MLHPLPPLPLQGDPVLDLIIAECYLLSRSVLLCRRAPVLLFNYFFRLTASCVIAMSKCFLYWYHPTSKTDWITKVLLFLEDMTPSFVLYVAFAPHFDTAAERIRLKINASKQRINLMECTNVIIVRFNHALMMGQWYYKPINSTFPQLPVYLFFCQLSRLPIAAAAFLPLAWVEC